MKRSQIILLSVFIVVTGLIYTVLASNKKDFDKNLKSEDKINYVPVQEVSNKIRMLTLTSYGQINPNAEVIVSMEVQGQLRKGDLTMKPGVNFKTGDILYRIDNEEMFYTISSQKSSLANLIINLLPEIELDFPSEQNKWLAFSKSLRPEELLPELPRVSSDKERMFLTSRNVYSQYYSLRSQEARMRKYFYAAPFNGTVVEIYAEPGAISNPGAQLAKIAKTGEFEVKVPISMEDLELYKGRSAAEFEDAAGKKVATGKIIRISNVVNQQTQSADVYYSIQPVEGAKIYNGMYVNVSINQKDERETMTLPRVAVKDGKVNVLNGKKVTQQDVVIISSKPDSVFVTGLKDGMLVVLEQMEDYDPATKYEGIRR